MALLKELIGRRQNPDASLNPRAPQVDFFRSVLARLAEEGIDYRVVGSVAVSSYTGAYSNNDIDVMCFGTRRSVINKIQEDVDPRHRNVDFNLLSGLREKRGFPLLASMLFEDGEYFLVFEDIKFQVSSKIMVPQTSLYKDQVPFKTFLPETLLHLYIARAAHLKPKDVGKLRALRRYILDHPSEGISHSEFGIFHEFSREIRKRYPVSSRLYEVLAKLDYVFGGVVGNALPDSGRRLLISKVQ